MRLLDKGKGMSSFGVEFRKLRRESGRTLADVAEIAGCSISDASRIERDQMAPYPSEILEKILCKFGCLNKHCFLMTYALAYQEPEFSPELEHAEKVLRGEVSDTFCCNAPIDTSHVIREGRNKNHGPRFCSKCKKLLFMV